jgi:pimeloyl-ACP methyl ester carboxylesterase
MFAFLDDHSRLAVGYRFGFAEDTVRLAAALQPALAARGVPGSCYVDNGSAYVDSWLLRACGKLDVRLIHSPRTDRKAAARSNAGFVACGSSSSSRSPTPPPSTGAAAALWAVADDPEIAAVVSRGGRPDLAARRLGGVRAPTLLVVGGRDTVVLELNRRAQARLRCESRLAVVPGATHLFDEPGTLEQAAGLARDWFVDHLGRPSIGRASTVR